MKLSHSQLSCTEESNVVSLGLTFITDQCLSSMKLFEKAYEH